MFARNLEPSVCNVCENYSMENKNRKEDLWNRACAVVRIQFWSLYHVSLLLSTPADLTLTTIVKFKLNFPPIELASTDRHMTPTYISL